MAKASEIKNGNILRFNGELVQMEEFIHRTPGNLRAFYQAKMRNVKTGKLVEYRFRVDEEVEIGGAVVVVVSGLVVVEVVAGTVVVDVDVVLLVEVVVVASTMRWPNNLI
jgi:hypothetical protein